jgi:hypothetical protein
LNIANVTLLPKKASALQIEDYIPISIIHSVAKLMGKIMANRLQPFMERLMSPGQSTFIRGRSIHDNF